MLGALGRHPGVGIGLTGIGISLNQQGPHTLTEGDLGSIASSLDEAIGPTLQPQPVPDDEVCPLGALQVARAGFVAVDFCPQPGDRAHLQAIPGHIAGHVGQHGEGGEHQGACVAGVGKGAGTWGRGLSTASQQTDQQT